MERKKENQAFPFCFQSHLVRKHPKSKTLRKLHKLLQYPRGEAILQAKIVYCKSHRMNVGNEGLESDMKVMYAQKLGSQ